jgi:TRAP-type mannitol/chloroaromatic compound transport system permease small subunit
MKAIVEKIIIYDVKQNVWTIFTYLIFLLLLIFAIVIFRYQYIKIGFELNEMNAKIKGESIKVQNLQLKKNQYVRKDVLYRKAIALGFVLPTADKVYYAE